MELKIKEYSIPLSSTDIIDVKLFIKKNEVVKFSLNYRSEINEVWYQIYRVDSYHGYLHEQKFWISPRPIKLPYLEIYPLSHVFKLYMTEIKNNFRRYKELYGNVMRGL